MSGQDAEALPCAAAGAAKIAWQMYFSRMIMIALGSDRAVYTTPTSSSPMRMRRRKRTRKALRSPICLENRVRAVVFHLSFHRRLLAAPCLCMTFIQFMSQHARLA